MRMSMVSSCGNKQLFRQDLHKARKRIPPARHLEARQNCFDELYSFLSAYDQVLSFASFGEEIDLWLLNRKLAADNRLLLPRVEGQGLKVYRVQDIDKDLTPSRWNILEPYPKLCEAVQPDHLSLVLVPGLGFDQRGYRIGYGQGYYDRFLSLIPLAVKIGVGFREQLVKDELPVAPHDIKLDAVKLF